ncbi:hypothetical protein D3C85_1816810 [compost metagenome]
MLQDFAGFIGADILVGHQQVPLQIEDKAPGPFQRAIALLYEFPLECAGVGIKALDGVVTRVPDEK